jgi:succinate dehydrogenase hydrophobic anchor subunit
MSTVNVVRKREWVVGTFVFIATTLIFVSLLLYSRIGLRDVMTDYAHNSLLRVMRLTLLDLVLTWRAVDARVGYAGGFNDRQVQLIQRGKSECISA